MKRLLLVMLILALALIPRPASGSIWLRDFAERDEWDTWAKDHIALRYWGDGTQATCVDYARMLQDDAYRDHYRMSVVRVLDGYIAPGIKVSPASGMHYINTVVIGNSEYAIEPHPVWYKVTYIGRMPIRRY